MGEWTERTEMLLGAEGVERLAKSRVAVFGVGGVGGFAVEALARAGVGAIELFDHDRVSESNINRQIIATRSTVGRLKTEVMAERIADINPECEVVCHSVFVTPEMVDGLDLDGFDYILDCIDSVSSKVEILAQACRLGVPVISAMGAGNKLDPTALTVSDISKTAVCPLARAVRVALRKRGIEHLRVVYSTEPPRVAKDAPRTPGSISFVPSAMGLIIAGEVIKDLSGIRKI